MSTTAPTGNCEKCGTPVNTSFGPDTDLHYYCEAHKDELFVKVTGRAFKKPPEPKK